MLESKDLPSPPVTQRMQPAARPSAGLLVAAFLAMPVLALLAGCQSPGTPAAPLAAAATAPPAEAVSTWSAGTLGDLLVAEVAGQRGQLDTAFAAYLRQARATRDPALAARATRIAWYGRQPAQIRDAALLWSELAPQDPEANANAVMGLVQNGEIEAAYPLLDRLLADQRQPVRFNFIVQYAQEADAPGRARVRDLLATLSTRHPGQPRLWLARSALADMDGDAPAALEMARHARELEPDNPAAIELEGRLLAATGDTAAARRLLRQGTREFPRERDLRLSYLRVLLEAGRGNDARRELNDMLAIWPEDGDLAMSLALVEWEMGEPDAARRRFVALAEAGYREDETWFYAGRVAAAQRRHEDAASYFQNVRGTRFLAAQVQVAHAWQRLGRLPDARALIATLRAQAPESAAQLYVAESELLWRAGDDAGALALLEQALANTPGDVELRYARALAAERVDRLDVTEADLRALLAASPDNPTLLNALGYTLADRTDRHEEALALIERALALAPNDPAIIDSMGWVLHRLGRHDEAITWLKRAWALSPDPEIGAHLGEVLWAAGKHREARRAWDRALAVDPDNTALKRTLERHPR